MIFEKRRSDENRPLFCKQRNKCVSLVQKVKRDYFTGLSDKYIAENKCFWKTVKPFLSNKAQSSEGIKLAEEDDFLVTNEEEAAMELNDFFSNVVNLKISKFENFDHLSENIDHPTLKAIVKNRNHPIVIAIASEFTKECFSFNTIIIENALKEISMIESSKTIQAADIPVKKIKDNSNSFAEITCAYFSESIGKQRLPNCLKLANITLVFKKGARTSKNN